MKENYRDKKETLIYNSPYISLQIIFSIHTSSLN